MTELFSTAKTTAKQALKDVWGVATALTLSCTAVVLVVLLFQSLLGMFLDISLLSYAGQNSPGVNTSWRSLLFSTFFCIFNLLVLSNVYLGSKAYYFYRSYGAENDVSILFMYFENLITVLKSAMLYLRIFAEMAVVGILIFAPAGGADILLDMLYVRNLTEKDKILLLMVSILSVLLFIVGAVFMLIYAGKFFAVPYLAASNLNLKNSEIIQKSKLCAKGNLSEIFSLKLSFIPLYISLVLAIPILYVLPFVNMTQAIYARYLMEKAGVAPQAEGLQTTGDSPAEPETQTRTENWETQATTSFSTVTAGATENIMPKTETDTPITEASPAAEGEENFLNHYFSEWEKQAETTENKTDE